MNYQQATTYLDALQMFTIKLGLEATQDMLTSLGNPEKKLTMVHLAGTNGKGSVGASIQSIVSAAGYRCGFFSSPHLFSVRERFSINGVPISEQQFATVLTHIHHVLKGKKVTYFECVTLIALLWFAQEGVDVAVIETGMGGRLDATNVISPAMTIITSIGFDHEDWLGSTLEEIAREKAGIIKQARPVITGVQQEEALAVIKQQAQSCKSPVYCLGNDFHLVPDQEQDSLHYIYKGINGHTSLPSVHISLPGQHQVENTALALACVELLPEYGIHCSHEACRQGVSQVKWPGRLEHYLVSRSSTEYHYLFDGAHNQQGIQALDRYLSTLSNTYQNLIFIWGCMKDKLSRLELDTFLGQAEHIVLTQAESKRSAKATAIKEHLPLSMHSKIHCTTNVEEALRRAEELNSTGDLICIAGSLYLVGKARELLFHDESNPAKV